MAQVLTKEEIPLMREACKISASLLVEIESHVKPGISTNELDKIGHEYTLSHGASPAPLGYNGFPKSLCTSVNDCICHGVPSDYVLKEGDIINIDVTSIKHGFYGDTSKTFFVGEVSQKAKTLTDCALKAMYKGIEAIQLGATTGDIGFAIGRFVTRKGFAPVEEIGGHGIGKVFHDEPFVPSVGKKGQGAPLIPWSCITVEPMVNEKSRDIKEFSIPGSSVKYYNTLDGGLSAQFEHTILIKDGSDGSHYEILTLP